MALAALAELGVRTSLTAMTRVLLVTNDFPPRRGGIQSYLDELVGQLAAIRDDYTLTVYAPQVEGLPRSSTKRPRRPAIGWCAIPAR